jgi:glycosyltransferase involved in cell wall biosynthesis
MASGPFLLVAGDFVQTGGMDRANFELSMSLATMQYEVQLVGHFADRRLLQLPNVIYHHAIRPGNSHFLGEPFLNRTGRHWAKSASARGGRVIVNGGNCRWHDINWVHYVHAAYEPVVSGSAIRRSRWRWSHRSHLRAERRAIKQARIVIVNSERTGRDVVEHLDVPVARVRRAYYGIDPSIYRPHSERERSEAKARFGWSPRPVAAFIGGLGDRRKSFDIVFDVWKILASRTGWDVDLAVIGAGAELADWISRAQTSGMSGRIRFLGFRKDLPDILEACDAMVAPARYEAYGMAVQECLCMGIAALASRISGVSEHYPEELNELLIEDPGDRQELVDRLWNWRQRKDHFDALVLQLSSRMRMHTWEKMTAEVLHIVNSG